MGGLNKTGTNSNHDAALLSAEVVRQSAVQSVSQGPAGQATMTAAEIAYHRAIVASCKANNNGIGLEGSLSALRALGVNS
jgi:hypothetical protein